MSKAPIGFPDHGWGTNAVKELRLETERLILRTYRLSDFEDHYKLCADPGIMRYLIGGKPMSRFEAWYAFSEMGRDHVISVIHPENKPSIRVAERLGEKLKGKTEVEGMPALIYGIDRQ